MFPPVHDNSTSNATIDALLAPHQNHSHPRHINRSHYHNHTDPKRCLLVSPYESLPINIFQGDLAFITFLTLCFVLIGSVSYLAMEWHRGLHQAFPERTRRFRWMVLVLPLMMAVQAAVVVVLQFMHVAAVYRAGPRVRPTVSTNSWIGDFILSFLDINDDVYVLAGVGGMSRWEQGVLLVEAIGGWLNVLGYWFATYSAPDDREVQQYWYGDYYFSSVTTSTVDERSQLLTNGERRTYETNPHDLHHTTTTTTTTVTTTTKTLLEQQQEQEEWLRRQRELARHTTTTVVTDNSNEQQDASDSTFKVIRRTSTKLTRKEREEEALPGWVTVEDSAADQRVIVDERAENSLLTQADWREVADHQIHSIHEQDLTTIKTTAVVETVNEGAEEQNVTLVATAKNKPQKSFGFANVVKAASDQSVVKSEKRSASVAKSESSTSVQKTSQETQRSISVAKSESSSSVVQKSSQETQRSISVAKSESSTTVKKEENINAQRNVTVSETGSTSIANKIEESEIEKTTSVAQKNPATPGLKSSTEVVTTKGFSVDDSSSAAVQRNDSTTVLISGKETVRSQSSMSESSS